MSTLRWNNSRKTGSNSAIRTLTDRPTPGEPSGGKRCAEKRGAAAPFHLEAADRHWGMRRDDGRRGPPPIHHHPLCGTTGNKQGATSLGTRLSLARHVTRSRRRFRGGRKWAAPGGGRRAARRRTRTGRKISRKKQEKTKCVTKDGHTASDALALDGA